MLASVEVLCISSLKRVHCTRFFNKTACLALLQVVKESLCSSPVHRVNFQKFLHCSILYTLNRTEPAQQILLSFGTNTGDFIKARLRSEEHTSELQSRPHLV